MSVMDALQERGLAIAEAVSLKPVFLDIETTGLYPIVHRIVCIACIREVEKVAIIDRDERRLLTEFLEFIQTGNTMIGFNLNFDYGFLVMRCMKYGLDPSRLISLERIDLLRPVKNLLLGKRVSLEALAAYFHIGYKQTSGKEIPELWEAGNHEMIREHCLVDVDLTAQLFECLKPLLFEPATAKQKDYMRSLGIPFDEDMTKAESSKLIKARKGA